VYYTYVTRWGSGSPAPQYKLGEATWITGSGEYTYIIIKIFNSVSGRVPGIQTKISTETASSSSVRVFKFMAARTNFILLALCVAAIALGSLSEAIAFRRSNQLTTRSASWPNKPEGNVATVTH